MNAVNNSGELRFFLSEQTKKKQAHILATKRAKSLWDITQRWLESDWNSTFDIFSCFVVWEWISLRECLRMLVRLFVCKNLAHWNSIYLNACSCQPTFWQSHQIKMCACSPVYRSECDAWKKQPANLFEKNIINARSLYILITQIFTF